MPSAPPASEDQFLALIDRHFPATHGHMPLGRGDDCAVIACPERMAVSTDLFIEDVHFRRSYFSPGDIGWKGLAVNVSDIAGMGCRPLGFSLGLMVPHEPLPFDFWDGMFAGMAALAGKHDLPLTGGDLSHGPALGLSICIWGAPPTGGRMLTRTAAEPGDTLLVCGNVGLVRAGLLALERNGGEARRSFPAAVTAHLRPQPQVDAGTALAAHPAVCGAMDVSDGLAQDLPRFLGPDLGAALTLPEDTLHPEILAYCAATGDDPALFAYKGGEDYALLAACAPDAADVLVAAIPGARAIGTVTAATGVFVNGTPAPARGFDHFSTSEDNS